MNNAGAQRAIRTIATRLREGRVEAKHLVAVLPLVDDGASLLLVYNVAAAPNEVSLVRQGISQIRLTALREFDLGKLSDDPVLALPAVGSICPELAENCPAFVDLAEAFYEDARDPRLLATREALATWLTDLTKEHVARDTKLDTQGIPDHIHRLRLSSLFLNLPVEGLLGVIPGPDLATCQYNATLFYEKQADVQKGTFTVRQVEPEDLFRDPPSGALILPASLRSCLPAKATAQPLELLLRDARRSRDWMSTGRRLHAAFPTLPRPPFYLDSPDLAGYIRNPFTEVTRDPLCRHHQAETAYVLAELTATKHARERGAERLVQTSRDRLFVLLNERAKDQVTGEYLAGLRKFYALGVTTSGDVASQIRELHAIVQHVVDGSSGHSHGVRAASLLRVLTFINALAQHTMDRAQIDQLKSLLPPAGTGTRAAYEPVGPSDTGKLDFTLATLARQLLFVADYNREIDEAERATGDAASRAAKLRTLATRARAFPRFRARLTHERALLQYICDRMADAAEDVAEALGDRPILDLRSVTPSAVTGEPVALTLEIANLSDIHAATDVLVQLRRTNQINIEGRGVYSYPRIGPLKNVAEVVEMTVQGEGRVELTFDVSYAGPAQSNSTKGPKLFRTSFPLTLDVRPPPRSIAPLPAVRPGYPAGRALVDPQQFYGRRAELRRVVNIFASESAETLLIQGPRRTGKTSFANMIAQILSIANARKSFDIPAEWNEKLDVYLPISVNLQTLGADPKYNTFFSLLLESLGREVRRYRQRPSAGQRDALQECLRFEREIERAFDVLQPGRKIVYLLDEMDVVHDLGVKGLYRTLRALIGGHSRLRWVLISARGMYDEKLYGSPLFNVVQPINLQHMGREDTCALVEGPASGVIFDSDAVNEIYQLTAGHPYITNVLCNTVMEVLYKQTTSRVRRQMVRDAADTLAKAGKRSAFRAVWRDASLAAQSVLAALARSTLRMRVGDVVNEVRAISGVPVAVLEKNNSTTVLHLLEQLEVQGVVEQNADGWGFCVPLVQTWLRVSVLDGPPKSWFTEVWR